MFLNNLFNKTPKYVIQGVELEVIKKIKTGDEKELWTVHADTGFISVQGRINFLNGILEYERKKIETYNCLGRISTDKVGFHILVKGIEK